MNASNFPTNSHQVESPARSVIGLVALIFAAVGVLAIAIVLALALVPILNKTGPENEHSDLPIENILDNPDSWIGKTVTLTGENAGWYSENAMGFYDNAIAQREILVVGTELPYNEERNPDNNIIEESTDTDNIQVTGLIKRFDLSALEKELSVDLPDSSLNKFNGQPIIIANQVEIVPEKP